MRAAGGPACGAYALPIPCYLYCDTVCIEIVMSGGALTTKHGNRHHLSRIGLHMLCRLNHAARHPEDGLLIVEILFTKSLHAYKRHALARRSLIAGRTPRFAPCLPQGHGFFFAIPSFVTQGVKLPIFGYCELMSRQAKARGGDGWGVW